MKKKNDGIKKGTLIIVLLVCIAAYLWVPEIHKTMNRIFKMFASGDFTVVRDFVASYGGYAALISFLLMIFQSIAAPLPAFLITFANASLFGWWKGAILSWSSAMVGAAICFYIAKILGLPPAVIVSILYPRRLKRPATLLKSPGVLSTSRDNVLFCSINTNFPPSAGAADFQQFLTTSNALSNILATYPRFVNKNFTKLFF